MKLNSTISSAALVISCLALLVALGPTVYAAATVGTADIQNHAVTTPKLADEAVTTTQLAPNAVTGAIIAPATIRASNLGTNSVSPRSVQNKSLTLSKLKGADVKLNVVLSAGAIPNGRCKSRILTVAGSKIGEMVLISLQTQGTLQDGVFIYGTQVAQNGQATAVICNMSGTTSSAINKLVRVVTLG